MEPRYRLFKNDVNFDKTHRPSNTPSLGISNYQYSNNNSKPHRVGFQDWKQNIPKILGEDVSSPTAPLQLLQNNQQTAVSQLSNVLNQSTTLRSKCDEINRMCSSFSNKELIELYPQLLLEIFGFSGSKTFGLGKYEPRRYYYDFNATYSFLSVTGCVFNVINKLMVDQDAQFHFPYKGLPAGIIEKMKNGQISLWYQNKLMVLPGNELVLACNALEYYMLLFSYYIIHPQTLQLPSQWSGVEDVLYIRLLEDYLKYFLPFDGINHSYPTNSPEKQDISSNLWKSSEYLHNSHNQSSPYVPTPPLQNILPAPSHAEVFLQILCDIWFGLNTVEHTNQEQEYKLPTVDHARVIRILVKYLHTFVNGNTEVQINYFSAGTYSHAQQLDEFKIVVIPALMHRPLYIYLQHCFTHWPLDGSFRMILETWLSFIQPWRYRDNTNKSIDDSLEINLSSWKPFVDGNMLFYTSIFEMFLLRALRFDMMSLQDVQLIYRVAKVFSQPSLAGFLKNETGTPSHGQINIRSGGGPMFLGLMSNVKQIQLEKPSEVTKSIFGQETTRKVQDLCQVMASTVISIRKKKTKASAGKKTGLLASIKDFFIIDDGEDFERDREKQRLIEYLEQTCILYTSTFKLEGFQTTLGESAEGSPSKYSNASVTFSDDTLPDFKVTENGIVLTDMGRYQILQGMRQFPITYSGDPELQPIRSYESLLAVKFLNWIACNINGKYSGLLENVYNGPSYITKLLRRFSKRLQNNHYIDTPFSLPQMSSVPAEYITPRVSLRFAGSYYFMGYVCWVVVLARLFGFSWPMICMTLFMLAVLCVFAHVDTPPKKMKSS